MTAYVCPDCGAARQRDGRPGCACAARAAAAAEDFDPLRIRPYVELREPAPASGPEQPPDAAGGPAPRSAAAPDSPAEGSPGENPAAGREPDGAPDLRPGRSAGGTSGPEPAAAPSASSPESGPGPAAVPGSGTGWDTLFRSPPAGPAPGNTGGTDGTDRPAGAGPPGDGPGTGRSAPGSAPSAGTAAERPADPAAPTTALPRFDGTGRPAGPDRPGDSGAGPGAAPETGGPAGEDDAPDITRPLSPLTEPQVLGAARGADSHPRAEDLGLFHDDAFADREPEDSGRPGAGRTGRRRRTAVIAGAAAAVVAVCAGVLGTGLLGGDKEERAAPNENSLTPTAVLPTDGNGPSASASASPSASVSANGGSPSASATDSSPSASPSGAAGSAAPDGTPNPTRASGSVSDAPDEPGDGSGSGQDDPPVLQKGMSGPEVLEMQQRLNQVGLFSTVDEDGSYDEQDERAIANYQLWNGVEGDPSGVYGPATRRSLEERTEEP
ncbi:peptidoglycan-binding protein [Streptomyces sp. WAC 00631]|uniref:peptidoglycan-binding protein n=1 Tax=Streptomyces sp. WAC 00631 TaxID=2203201 RepID=UPI001E3B0051|nr:peptidoglycan-binding protein [Streptomyces sp. WAC 00631]MCC5034783.1 peptidoglycan-binding protein [Streptomyces sp. WAC 00631]